MTLKEWLDQQIDISSAVYDVDKTLGHKVDMHQTCLAAALSAIRAIDDRLSRLESAAGLEPFDFIPE